MLKRIFRRHPVSEAELSAYVDGAPAEPEAQRLEAHLAACAACRTSLEELRAVKSAVQALPSLRAPRSFALREADVRPAATRRPAVPLGALAAASLVLFVAILSADLATLPRGGGLSQPAAQERKELAPGAAPATGLGGAAQDAEKSRDAAPRAAAPEQATPSAASSGAVATPERSEGEAAAESPGGGSRVAVRATEAALAALALAGLGVLGYRRFRREE